MLGASLAQCTADQSHWQCRTPNTVNQQQKITLITVPEERGRGNISGGTVPSPPERTVYLAAGWKRQAIRMVAAQYCHSGR
jgi:hypothetical protein